MQYDCAGGQDHLETSARRAMAAASRKGPKPRQDVKDTGSIVESNAAEYAVHGCCAGDSDDEYERWDGMA